MTLRIIQLIRNWYANQLRYANEASWLRPPGRETGGRLCKWDEVFEIGGLKIRSSDDVMAWHITVDGRRKSGWNCIRTSTLHPPSHRSNLTRLTANYSFNNAEGQLITQEGNSGLVEWLNKIFPLAFDFFWTFSIVRIDWCWHFFVGFSSSSSSSSSAGRARVFCLRDSSASWIECCTLFNRFDPVSIIPFQLAVWCNTATLWEFL